MTIFQTLSTVASRRGHQPAVVFCDARTGERTELSWATLHNWVSKCANLLADELDVGLGSEVVVDLPLHWMAPVVCLSAWAAGAAVRPQQTIGSSGPGSATAGDVLVAFESEPGAAAADLLIGAAMGGRLTRPLDGEALTVVDILAQPDDFIDDPGDVGAWAIDGRTQATLLADAVGGEGVTALHAGDRLEDETVRLLGRALPAGTSVVLARGFDAAGLKGLAQQERVT